MHGRLRRTHLKQLRSLLARSLGGRIAGGEVHDEEGGAGAARIACRGSAICRCLSLAAPHAAASCCCWRLQRDLHASGQALRRRLAARLRGKGGEQAGRHRQAAGLALQAQRVAAPPPCIAAGRAGAGGGAGGRQAGQPGGGCGSCCGHRARLSLAQLSVCGAGEERHVRRDCRTQHVSRIRICMGGPAVDRSSSSCQLHRAPTRCERSGSLQVGQQQQQRAQPGGPWQHTRCACALGGTLSSAAPSLRAGALPEGLQDCKGAPVEVACAHGGLP